MKLLPIAVALETKLQEVTINVIETPEDLKKVVYAILKDKDLSTKRGPFNSLLEAVRNSIQ